MDTEYKLYYPYRVHGICSAVLMGVVMLACLLMGYYLSTKQYAIVFIAMGFSIVGGLLSKFMYGTSRIVVRLTCDGIQVEDAYRKKHKCFRWESDINIYTRRTYRGFLFLVISKKPLPEKELKDLVNKGSETCRVVFDEMIMFPIEESSKEGRKIQEIVLRKTEDGSMSSEAPPNTEP